jgi:DMSO/TMAO reductase YedYZ molybdopterin-dependent catalytic subunit
VTQLAAVAFGPHADSRTAIGSTVIDLTPGPVKEWAIQTFGTNDKLMLTIAVLIAIAAIAAFAARFETRRRPVGSVVVALAGVAGCAAVVSRAGAGWTDIVPTVIGTICGIALLRYLISRRFTGGPLEDAAAEESTENVPNPSRRRSLVTLGFLTAGVVAGVTGSTLLRLRSSVAGDREAFVLPAASAPPPTPPLALQPPGAQLPPFFTPNADFYRIDTALSTPQLSRPQWRLRIHGMVDREISLGFDDLNRFEVVEKAVTLTCVSNPVGGELVGNAKWTGYRVSDLLAAAGVKPDSDMVLSTSIDGFTAGTPTEALTDDRESLLAIGMNGSPLPVEHGYPARLVVPGLYGYVSATKWVVDLELTRFDLMQGYWTPLGWSARGPIKTESRIDVPRSGQSVPRGAVTFGGVAWAQHIGVRGVEVHLDGPGQQDVWRPAQLGASYSKDCWRLWSFGWQATEPGSYEISVRATDETGATQTAQRADVMPNGATGWHTVSFTVT